MLMLRGSVVPTLRAGTMGVVVCFRRRVLQVVNPMKKQHHPRLTTYQSASQRLSRLYAILFLLSHVAPLVLLTCLSFSRKYASHTTDQLLQPIIACDLPQSPYARHSCSALLLSNLSAILERISIMLSNCLRHLNPGDSQTASLVLSTFGYDLLWDVRERNLCPLPDKLFNCDS